MSFSLAFSLASIVIIVYFITSCNAVNLCPQKKNLTSQSGNITSPMTPDNTDSDINSCWYLVGPTGFAYDFIVVYVNYTNFGTRPVTLLCSDVPLAYIKSPPACIIYKTSNFTTSNFKKVFGEFPGCATSLHLRYLKTPPVEIKLISYVGSYPLWANNTLKLDLEYRFFGNDNQAEKSESGLACASKTTFYLSFVLGFLFLASFLALAGAILRKKLDTSGDNKEVRTAKRPQVTGVINEAAEVTESENVVNVLYKPCDKKPNGTALYEVVDEDDLGL